MNRATAMAGGGAVRGMKLPVKGHIKAGKKGPIQEGKNWQTPQKLPHFLITTLERDKDNNFVRDEAMHKIHGERPTVLPIQLIYNDLELNYSDYIGAWRNKTRWCFSDGCSGVAERLVGEGPQREEVACPCPRLDPTYAEKDKCKPHGRLDCIIEGAYTVGGVYRLDTTSWGSCEGLESSLDFIQRLTGGRLAGLPLNLTLSKQTKTNPVTNKPVEVYIIGIEYRGSVEELRLSMIKQIEADRSFFTRIAAIEAKVPRDNLRDLEPEEEADIAEEFHPEAAAEQKSPPPTQDGGGVGEADSDGGRRRKIGEADVTTDDAPKANEDTKKAAESSISEPTQAKAAPTLNLDDSF